MILMTRISVRSGDGSEFEMVMGVTGLCKYGIVFFFYFRVVVYHWRRCFARGFHLLCYWASFIGRLLLGFARERLRLYDRLCRRWR